MGSNGYTPFFRRYYGFVYLLFSLSLISSQTGMDMSFLLLLIGLLSEAYLHPERLRWNREILAVVLLYLGLLLIPEVIHFSWWGLEELVLHHYRKVFLVFLLMATLRTTRMLSWTSRFLMVFASLAALLTALAYFTRLPYLYFFVEGGFVYPDKFWLQGWIRGNGPASWKSVQFGNIMAFLLPFLLFFAWKHLQRRNLKRALAYGLGLASVFLGIVVSESRMPLLAASSFLLLVLVGWIARRSWKWLRGQSTDSDGTGVGFVTAGVIFLLALTIIAGPLLSPQVRWRFRKAASGVQSSDRLEMWRAVYRQTFQSPGEMLLGAGTKRGMKKFKQVKEKKLDLIDVRKRKHAHNTLVQYFLDYGIFGLLAYGLLWGFFLRKLMGTAVTSSLWIYRYGGFGVLYVVNLCGLTEFNWGRSPTHYNAAFLMGLVLVALDLARTNPSPVPTEAEGKKRSSNVRTVCPEGHDPESPT